MKADFLEIKLGNQPNPPAPPTFTTYDVILMEITEKSGNLVRQNCSLPTPQVKGHLCGFIWLPVWPRLPITWGSTPLQTLSITGAYNAIPETLQGTLERQTPCNTYKYTYLHDIKCEERSNLPNSRDGHEHGLK